MRILTPLPSDRLEDVTAAIS